MSSQGNGQPPEDDGGQQGGNGELWSGGQQPWSTGETGPNVGPTMNNPQSSYYDKFSQASGEGVVIPSGDGNKGGRGKVLLALAAALVVVIAVVAAFALTRGSNSPTTAAGTSTGKLPPVQATTWVNPTEAGGARALQAGWVSQIGGADMPQQYDVPDNADWKVESRGMIHGYSDSKGMVTIAMAATSVFGTGYCPSDKQAKSAMVGMRNIGKQDPTDAGATTAQKFADGIAASQHNKPGRPGKLSAARQINVDQGTIPAVQYTITATAGDPNSCDVGKTYEVRTVSFSAHGRSYQFVTVRVLGGAKELSTASLEEIISTFRPAG